MDCNMLKYGRIGGEKCGRGSFDPTGRVLYITQGCAPQHTLPVVPGIGFAPTIMLSGSVLWPGRPAASGLLSWLAAKGPHRRKRSCRKQ